jgi:hypothetical protein
LDQIAERAKSHCYRARGTLKNVDKMQPGARPPADSDPTAVGSHCDRSDLAIVPRPNRQTQRTQRLAFRQPPQPHGLIERGRRQQRAGSIDADATDRRRMHARIDAQDGLLQRCRVLCQSRRRAKSDATQMIDNPAKSQLASVNGT